MISFDFEKECYSCAACVNVCKQNAISFDKDLLPVIDKEKCISCGMCDKVCVKENEEPFTGKLASDAQGMLCRNCDLEQRKSSSSGGIFILLADKVLSEGGYVCGCIYDDSFMPQHVVSNEKDTVEKMMGSKYVMSDIGHCIREMRNLLKDGYTVLFSGVPCQTAAVYNCLKNYSNLILVSVVCHGSISRKVWRAFLEGKKQQGGIKNITMRDKSHGWLNYGLKISYEDGTEQITYRKENGYFLRCFTSGLFERDRCLSCRYKGNKITADILLGDGWGVDTICPELADELGVSSVICLTDKGKVLFDSISDFVTYKSADTGQLIEHNQRIISPAPENKCRKKFSKKIADYPDRIDAICGEFSKETMFRRLTRRLMKLVRKD